MEEDQLLNLSWMLQRPKLNQWDPRNDGRTGLMRNTAPTPLRPKNQLNPTSPNIQMLELMKGEYNPNNAPIALRKPTPNNRDSFSYLDGLDDAELTLEQIKLMDQMNYNNRFNDIYDMITSNEGGHFENGYSITHDDPIKGSALPTNAGQTRSGMSPIARGYLTNRGYNLDDVFTIGGKIKQEDAANLRKMYMYQSRPFLQKTYPEFDDMPFEVKAILHDMHYNLGNGLGDFVKMNAAFNSGDYKTAAREMKDSKYYNQTGNRPKRHIRTLNQLNRDARRANRLNP